MYEIFLFINPIGTYCFDAEKEFKQTMQELGAKVSYHFVTLANLNSICQDMQHRKINCQQHQQYDYYSHAAFSALNYYHAVRLAYGNRKARQFLFQLQLAVNTQNQVFNQELVQELLVKNQLKPDKIRQVLTSPYLQESINQDSQLAKKWQIKQTPTAVVFNEQQLDNSGLLLEGKINQEDILEALAPKNYEQCHERWHLHLL
jgi:predicted DsbA family dithiol-disulfide isomerase